MSDWKTRKMGNVAQMCLGKMLDKEKNKGEFKPYLANINVRWGGFDFLNLNKMRFEESENERYSLKFGDLVICEGGEPGRCAIWKDEIPEMKIQKALHRVRVNENYSNQFVYYRFLLAGKTGELKNHFIGSTIKHLTGVGLKQVEFTFPSLDEQQKIASVLSVLDSKIELNNRINTELEAMAKTLYDYWFVQFDFPDANGKPYKTSGGKMVYNAALKREIPEGWADIKMGKMEPNIVTGKTPSTANSDYFNGEIPFITIGDIRGSAFIVKTEQTLSIEGANSQGNKYLPKGAICVTCIASPGLVGFVTQTSQTNQQINSVICSNEFNRYFLYFAINGYFAGAKAKIGNTFANMNKGDFSEILVVEPLEDIRKLFHEKIDAVFKEIKIKSQENIQLEQLRDYLLPMLMNGQVTVVNKDDI